MESSHGGCCRWVSKAGFLCSFGYKPWWEACFGPWSWWFLPDGHQKATASRRIKATPQPVGKLGSCISAHTRLGFLPGQGMVRLGASSWESEPGTPSTLVSRRNHKSPSCADKGTIVPRENLLESNAGSPGRKRNSLFGHSPSSGLGVTQTWMHVWLWQASRALPSRDETLCLHDFWVASFGCSSDPVLFTVRYITPPPHFTPSPRLIVCQC